MLEERSSARRKVRFPREGAISPAKLMSLTFSTVTRAAVLHATLAQKQWWKLSFQELKAPFGSFLTAFLKSSNERRSVVLSEATEQ